MGNFKIFLLKYYKYILFFSFAILFLNMTGHNISPCLTGDGLEYFLMNQSFKNHFTPDLQLRDVDSCKVILTSNHESKILINNLDSIYNQIQKYNGGKLSWQPYGFYKSYNGKYYSYHFWGYSLLCLPVSQAFYYIGGNQVRSFQVTNTLLIILLLAYILFYSKINDFQKIFAIALYLLCGNLYYLLWSSPEIMSSSLLFLSLLSLNDRRYFLSMFSLVIASLQNAPIALFIPYIIFVFWFRNGFNIKTILSLILVGSISLIPAIFYLLNFGVPNIITAIGAVSNTYMSWKKLSGLFFDLNQGIIVAAPFVLLFYICLGIYDIIYLKNKSNSIIFPFLVICMAIPCIGQNNWNMGEYIFIRYGVWISIPILIYLVIRFDFKKRYQKIIAVLLILGQLYVSNSNKWFMPEKYYLEFNEFTKYIFNKYPSIYNPDPEIFAERISYREGALEDSAIFIYRDNNNSPTKILIRKDKIDDIKSSTTRNTVIRNTKNVGNWVYYNLK